MIAHIVGSKRIQTRSKNSEIIGKHHIERWRETRFHRDIHYWCPNPQIYNRKKSLKNGGGKLNWAAAYSSILRTYMGNWGMKIEGLESDENPRSGARGWKRRRRRWLLIEPPRYLYESRERKIYTDSYSVYSKLKELYVFYTKFAFWYFIYLPLNYIIILSWPHIFLLLN